MKRLKYLILTIIFCVPMLVNATNTTYNVCKNGCEYTELETVLAELEARGSHFENDYITINITDSETYTINDHRICIADTSEEIKDFTINGNNATLVLNDSLFMYAKQINIKDVTIKDYWDQDGNAGTITGTFKTYADKLNLTNVKVGALSISEGEFISNVTIDSSEIANIAVNGNVDIKDTEARLIRLANGTKYKLQNVTTYDMNINRAGGTDDEMSNIDFDNVTVNNLAAVFMSNGTIDDSSINSLFYAMGTLDIKNSSGKVLAGADGEMTPTVVNIYNTKNTSLDYQKVTNDNQMSEITTDDDLFNNEAWKHTYSVVALEGANAEINIFFDGTKTIKVNDKLDFSTLFNTIKSGDKLTYKVDDTSVAKMDGNNIVGLKEGTTKITATSENGAVNYILNLTVEKATIMDKMNVDVPITGKSIKLWMIILAGVLFGVIGVAVYMLIRRKK